MFGSNDDLVDVSSIEDARAALDALAQVPGRRVSSSGIRAQSLETCELISRSLRGTKVVLKHKDTGEVAEAVNLAEFCRERGLPDKSGTGLTAVVKGHAGSYHGWELIGEYNL